MLETSEREFAARFAPYAAEGTVYAQTEGSPLLEFASGGRVLYLFDRSGPYAARPGPARLIVHGVLDPQSVQVLDAAEAQPPEETLTVLGISAVEGRGRLLAQVAGAWVVQARVPLVLSSFTPLAAARPGDWVAFRTQPPLHGFLVS